MVKALFLDIDGTLVSFRTHGIPPSTITALAGAKAAGVKIFIATGRPMVLINNLKPLQEPQLIDGYITMNGSYCFAGDTVIYKRPIPAEDVQTFVRYCADRNIPDIVVGEKDITVCRPGDKVREVFYDYLGVDLHIPEVEPVDILPGKEVYQLTPFVNQDEEDEVRPALKGCEINRWHPAFVDVTATGNTKQKGLDEVISHFGIRLEDTMAIGDGGNDIPMLVHAGIGVAMGNADDAVKASADYVTASVDEDGIARALERFGVK